MQEKTKRRFLAVNDESLEKAISLWEEFLRRGPSNKNDLFLILRWVPQLSKNAWQKLAELALTEEDLRYVIGASNNCVKEDAWKKLSVQAEISSNTLLFIMKNVETLREKAALRMLRPKTTKSDLMSIILLLSPSTKREMALLEKVWRFFLTKNPTEQEILEIRSHVDYFKKRIEKELDYLEPAEEI